ncbi:hypothetical protein Ct61P_06430 [Colletotrichum tofieldiae]|nr:hypothetical protein Ct61P_06430 [Colletotrichum tofieldiae]
MPEADYIKDGYEFIEYRTYEEGDFTLHWKGSNEGSIRKGKGLHKLDTTAKDGELVHLGKEPVVVTKMWCKEVPLKVDQKESPTGGNI